MSSGRVEESFSSTAENVFENFLIDRRLKTDEHAEYSVRPFKGYGNVPCNIEGTAQKKWNGSRRTLWNVSRGMW